MVSSPPVSFLLHLALVPHPHPTFMAARVRPGSDRGSVLQRNDFAEGDDGANIPLSSDEEIDDDEDDEDDEDDDEDMPDLINIEDGSIVSSR